MDTINLDAQEDFLRASIDSYSWNQDQTLAAQRYASLGESRGFILIEIYNNPEDQDLREIEAFVEAVGAQDELLSPAATTPTPAPVFPNFLSNILANQPILIALLPICGAILLILLIILLIVLLFRRARKSSRRKKEQQSLMSVSEEIQLEKTMDTSPVEAPDNVEQAPFEISEQFFPSMETETEKIESKSAQIESEFPDWLKRPVEETKKEAEEPVKGYDFELSEKDIQEIYASPFASIEKEAPIAAEPYAETPTPQSTELPKEQPVEEIEQPNFIEETPEETFAKFSQDISNLPEIDSEVALKLKAIGISAPLLLLRKGAFPEGRQTIAAQINLTEIEVLELIKFTELLRINGMKTEDLRALKTVGISSIADLAESDPESLHSLLLGYSQDVRPEYSAPSKQKLAGWKQQAENLPQAIM